MIETKRRCAEVPQLDRLAYFYGQMLHAADFQAEQAYFREKLKLHNRCLHGWGVVCGLLVEPQPPSKECAPASDAERTEMEATRADLQKQLAAAATEEARAPLRAQLEMIQRLLDRFPPAQLPPPPRTRVQITCGLAIDAHGNEIVVRASIPIDLWSGLSPAERDRIDSGEKPDLYVGICYRECPVDPVRRVVPDACGSLDTCAHARIRDAVAVVVTLDGERWKDDRCEPCCEEREDGCVLLARIEGFAKGQPLDPQQIHEEARRPLSLHPATTITGINWVHDGVYTQSQAAALLGTEGSSPGLQVRFSAPVLPETLTRGVVDAWLVEGGSGRSAGVSNIDLDVRLDTGATLLSARDKTGETLNEKDRVLVTVRTAFLLDRCCHPVDGTHVGGRVPLLPGSPAGPTPPAHAHCRVPPRGYGPWTSGWNGAGSFESWFWIRKNP